VSIAATDLKIFQHEYTKGKKRKKKKKDASHSQEKEMKNQKQNVIFLWQTIFIVEDYLQHFSFLNKS
jgi:hypothetical protein